MTGDLLVGVAQAVDRSEPRRYVTDLVGGLRGMGVHTKVLMLRDGIVNRDLRRLADVRYLPPLPSRSPAGVAESIARRTNVRLAKSIRSARTRPRRAWVDHPDVVHLNGPQAVPVLQYVDPARTMVTTYVHPDDLGVAELAPADRQLLIAATDRFLAADDNTAERLAEITAIADRVELAPSPLVFPVAGLSPPERAAARSRWRLPADGMIVGVPPVGDWMEAPDLTIALAWELTRRPIEATPHLLWFGEPESERLRWPIEHDIRRVGLTNLTLAPAELSAGVALGLVDVLVLPSRSAVPIDRRYVKEAAASRVPVVCWRGHPIEEAIAAWTGRVIEQPNVSAMADVIVELADPSTRATLAAKGSASILAELERLVPLGFIDS